MGMSYAKARLRLSRLENEIAVLKKYMPACPAMDAALAIANAERAELQKLMPDESDDDVRGILGAWAYSDDREKSRVAEYVDKLRDKMAHYIEKNAAANARIVELAPRVRLLEKALDVADKEFSTNFSGVPSQWSWLTDAQRAIDAEDAKCSSHESASDTSVSR